MKLISPLPYPGDLKNLIKTAVAFSNPDDELDYFRRLYYTVTGEKPENIKKLQEQNFTIREIEILSNEIDESSIEVYDETKNVFNPISVNDYTTFAKKQKEAVAEEAIENGLLSEAATKTQSTIKKYLNAIPGIDGNYEIKVKFLETKKES